MLRLLCRFVVQKVMQRMKKIKFTHGALSPSDPSQVPMKFSSKEDADAHAHTMNSLIESWGDNPHGVWNKDHWKTKPEPWVVTELK
jgi:hypothetical protein